MPVSISLRSCRRVAPPSGFYRVSRWHQPFDPPPPPPAIDDDAVEENPAGRWDDPDGVFRTLYCATLAEGAIGEKLGDFALNPRAAVRVETFLESDPDGEFVDDQLIRPLERGDVESFNWKLAWAPAEPQARFLDVNHWRTLVATAPSAGELLLRFGLRALDRRAVLDERRNFTRRLARLWREAATSASGQLSIRGLRFMSRLPPAWICWALWEPLPLDLSMETIELVTIDHPAFRAVARKLGVGLAP